jgi:outer membrane receptor protein involved in Fe transport
VEAGIRWQVARRFSVDLAAFRDGYSDLEASIGGQPYFDAQVGVVQPLRSANAARARTFGTEMAASLDINYRWRVTGSVTRYNSAMQATFPPSPVNSLRPNIFPGIQWQLHNTYELNRRLQWNTSWYRVGALADRDGVVPAYDRVDSSLRWRWSEWVGLTVGVQNALNSRIYQWRPEDGLDPQVMRRTAYVRLQWWF